MAEARSRAKPKDIDEYIAAFPPEIQERLVMIRQAVKATVPEAQETISYGMPAFQLNGPLAYFAAFKSHIGFYPTPSGVSEFSEELSHYKQGKGSVQFPNDAPIPLDLVRRIVKFKAKENAKRAKKQE
ncbi:MAG: DUF1801 domain-containing protein [Methanomassiliicoccus sp.]|nr:DUF1801 domain-containing protein [Methanomassiliicoccus sp.]